MGGDLALGGFDNKNIKIGDGEGKPREGSATVIGVKTGVASILGLSASNTLSRG